MFNLLDIFLKFNKLGLEKLKITISHQQDKNNKLKLH